MSKMTDNHIADDGKKVEEVIKALEFCSHCVCDDDKTETKCPYYNMPFCKNYLRKQSLDLINRQQAEIERFKKSETTVNEFWRVLQKFTREKLKEKPTIEELLEYIEHAKAEAIKEFAKKIDDEIYEALTNNENVIREREIKYNVNRFDDIFCSSCMGKNTALCGIHDFITELVKEKVGADNG